MNSILKLILRRAVPLILSAFPLASAWAQTELIVNGGFESGSTGWILSGSPFLAEPATDGGLAHSGMYYLWMGGATNEIDAAYQTITIPGNATSCTLSFYYNIDSREVDPVAYDTFKATIRNTTGTILATVGNWSNVDKDPGLGNPYYHQKTFNLLPYAGQTIRVQFSSSNDSTLITNFRVDDVSVQVQTVVLPPPANDQCAAAIAMTANSIYTVNTAGATATGDPTPTCQPTFGKGVWYTFTPSATGAVTISTCASDFDTVLEVYTGACGSLTPLSAGCDDDKGPACASNRASVGFAGTGGTTYHILAGGYNGASGNLSIVATVAPLIANGLRIIPSFDSGITGDPQAATIEATINYAIAVYESSFSDPVTVTIMFQKVNTGLATSSGYYLPFSYSSYRSALVSHASTPDDATALAHLPVNASNPVNGNSNVRLDLPLARALGFSADAPPGQTDGIISLKTADMNLSAGATDPMKYSLFAAACHEIDEVLGLASVLNGLSNGSPSPTGAIYAEDLFRYDQFGARSFTTAIDAISYFSLDGTTHLAQFNQYDGGDFQDWYSFYGGQTPQVQDAFAAPGAAPVPVVELRVLDVIGYHLVIPTPPPLLHYAKQGNNVVLSWPTNITGFVLESTMSLRPVVWSTVPSFVSATNNVATNALTGAMKFYRLRK